MTLGAQASSGDSDKGFYIDSGASDHLILSRGDLHSVNSLEWEAEAQDM